MVCSAFALAVLLFPLHSSVSEKQSGYSFLLKWGTKGNDDGQFMYSRDVAIGRLGNVYVADAYNNRIQKFTSDGVFLTKWGTEGDADGQFNSPCSIAADNYGNIYVADTYNNRIQKFTSGGDFLAGWGTEGRADGQFDRPFGVAVDNSGHVYAADTYNHRIQKFTSDGVFVTKWGAEGDSNGQFNYPHGVAVDVSGNVYVADKDNHRIQKFTSDGVFMTGWGGTGGGNGQFDRALGVALDSDANVYVADTGNNRIQKFSPDGDFLTMLGTEGDRKGLFNKPFGIAIDSSGNVYVADTSNHRVQKFVMDEGILPPVADFSAQPESGESPLTVRFTDLSKNDPTGWLWDFGTANSNTSALQNPTYWYTEPGHYTVELRVVNPAGVGTEIKAEHIYVTQREMTIGRLVQDMSEQYKIELPLMLALMKIESNFKPDAISKTGAVGLMQLVSGTARDLGLKVPKYRDERRPNMDPNVDERFDPAKSVRCGAKYLRDMLDKYDGNYVLAVAAYNAGPGKVSKSVPLIRETERHANKVLNHYFRYKNSPETQTEALQVLSQWSVISSQ